jgi:DNA-binding MarR family transcriptional regulator
MPGGDAIPSLSTPPEPPSDSYETRILRSLRRIIRATAIYSRDLQARHKVTVPQVTCLYAIGRDEPTTATRLAREVLMSPSTVVGILDRLEAAGLVRRERDAADRRVVNVTLTEAGLRLVARSHPPLQQELAQALETLPELERATIALSLERLVTLLEVGQLDAAPILEPTEDVQPEAGPAETGDRPAA